MLIKIIKISFNKFNELANYLINAFTKNNLDEDSVIFLAKQTRHLLSFTQKILLKLLFKFFKMVGFIGNKISDDFIDLEKMIDIIFGQINISLNNILSKKYDKKQQEDIDNIIEYLTFLKQIINSLSNLFISAIKFNADIIKEDEFRKDYRNFKYDLTDEKINLDKLLKENKDEVPIN